MIPLRIVHVLEHLGISAAASHACNLMRWLKRCGHDNLMVAGEGQRAGELREEGFELVTFEAGGADWWLRGKRRLRQTIGQWNPDLLHVHHAESLPQFLGLAEKLNLPVIVDLQSRDQAIDGEDCKHPAVAACCVPSEALRAHVVNRMGIETDRIAVVPYSVDFHRYPDCGPIETVRTVGAIGRYQERFGFADLVAALGRLHERSIPLRGRLIGGHGDQENRTREQVADLGIAEHVEFLPATIRNAPQIEAMDVFCYPCHDDVLTLGALKAMACSRPVVATAVGSMTEWIREGENGLLVPPRDPDALADAFARLHADPPAAAAMGVAGRRRVEADHDIELIGVVIHDLYRGVLRAGAGHNADGEVVRAYRRATDHRRESTNE